MTLSNRMRALVMFVVLGLFTACGAPRHSLGRPAGEVAVVKGSSDNALQMLGVNPLIVIQTVDGQDLKQGALRGYPDEVELLPGRHQLGIFYSFYIDNRRGPDGKTTLELDAVAGKTYQIRERFRSGQEVSFVFEEAVAR
jgi:hypothetical protein